MKFNRGLAGAGGNWPTENEQRDPNVIVQEQWDYCGCACALIAFDKLGISVSLSQNELFDMGGSEMFSGDSLAEMMNDVCKLLNAAIRWTGQFVVPPRGSDYREVIRRLNGRGPWIAHMREPMERVGHFVVVVGAVDNMVHILDPAAPGTSYRMAMDTFLEYWSWGAVYIETQ